MLSLVPWSTPDRAPRGVILTAPRSAGGIVVRVAVTHDEIYEFQWQYETLNLPEVRDTEMGSTEKTAVTILHTGRMDHPALSPF